jgi:putative flippase GtrA
LNKFIGHSDLIRFALVGAVGFCIDGGLLSAFISFGWDIIPGRFTSFFFAVSITWILNRLWTFRFRKKMSTQKEYAHYLGIQLFGALINLSIFLLLIKFFPLFIKAPLIPLAFGAAVSLLFNYMLSKATIFRK